MKKILAIVVLTALFLASFSMLLTQTVKAQSSEVTVISYSSYVAPSTTVLASEAGDLIVVGEVENVGSNIVGNVTIEGIAFSSTGSELATATTQAFVYDMLPSQKAPFYLDLNAASSTTNDLSWVPSVSTVDVTVTAVTDTSSRQYSGLEIPVQGGSTSYLPGNGTYYVIGTVVNQGDQVAQDPWVVTTFYNSNGTVVGMNFTDYLTPSLPAGSPIRFYASPADDTSTLTNEIASYSTMVDSLTPSNSTSTATPTPPSTTSKQFPTLPVVVIVVVVIVVVIAAFMLLRKRQKTEPPPPPPPPPPMP